MKLAIALWETKVTSSRFFLEKTVGNTINIIELIYMHFCLLAFICVSL